MAAQIPQLNQTSISASVKVTNGALMQCSSIVLSCPWPIESYCFHQDLKLLLLDSYDLILGMDWLESFSSIKIHWKHKWLLIPYYDHQMLLQGIRSPSNEEPSFHLL